MADDHTTLFAEPWSGPAAGDVEGFCALVRGLLARREAERALRVAEAGLRRFSEEGNADGEAKALLMQAFAYAGCKPEDTFGAAEIAQNAAEALREREDAAGELEALRLVVRVHVAARQGEEAVQAAKALVRRCKQLEDEAASASGQRELGEALLVSGLPEEALRATEAAAALCRQANDMRGTAACQLLLCDIRLAAEEPDEALESASKARALCERSGDARGLAGAVSKQALAHQRNGHHVESLRAVEAAIKLWRDIGDAGGEVDSLVLEAEAKLSICEERAGRAAPAVPLSVLNSASTAVTAAKAWRKHDYMCVGNALYTHARVLFLMGSFKNAELAAKGAVKAFRKARHDQKRAQALALWAEVDVKRGFVEDARLNAGRALELFERAGDADGAGRIGQIYDQINKALGIPTQAELEDQQRQQLLYYQQMAAMGQQDTPPQQLQVAQQPNGTTQHGQAPLAAFKREGSPLQLSAGMDPAMISSKIVEIVKQIIGHDEEFEADLPLMEVGLTSNTAVILRDELSKDLPGINLPPTLIFDYPSVVAITDFVVEKSKMIA